MLFYLMIMLDFWGKNLFIYMGEVIGEERDERVGKRRILRKSVNEYWGRGRTSLRERHTYAYIRYVYMVYICI